MPTCHMKSMGSFDGGDVILYTFLFEANFGDILNTKLTESKP